MTKSLFPENDFTRENLLAWAEERVALEPVITVAEIQIANTTERILREILGTHYRLEYEQYDRNDFLHELLAHVWNGMDKPLNQMNESELLDELVQICTPSDDGSNVYEFETMDDFVRQFGDGG